ncbi:2Fe-2S iron-sulfur cluster-binding protein [Domibacillus robiginosus]|uniref:2Fe-2S iron-sulfur cluster-binding protein n=1 Tax=Domibacillus robiginosus TaxID=1071054 RepID=UPI000A8D66BC|nr:2Fe-2S iron-sulfur cluster-binding protein [Domibacillus robiginosus]
MNKEWTVGSLIPGREATRLQPKQPNRSAEEKKLPAPMIEWKQKERSCSVPVTSGVTLLDAALRQGCTIDYKCRKGTCGRCAVEVMSGETFLSSKNEAERKKLGAAPRRLACQAVIREK